MFGKYRCRHILSVLFISVMFTGGCVREEDGECASSLVLSFVYDLHFYSRDLFAEEIEHLHIYIYDDKGELVLAENLPRLTMPGSNWITYSLEPGTYTAVCWANIHTDNFFDEDIESLESLKIGLRCVDSGGRVATASPGTLFHSMSQFEVKAGKNNYRTLTFTKNSKIINVRVNGVSGDDVRIITEITGSNILYRYDNTIHPQCREVTYISEQEKNGKILNETLQVYRLFADDTDIKLIVRSEGYPQDKQYYAQESIVPVILKGITTSHQDYLDRSDEFFLTVNFTGNGAGTIVSVESWEEIEDETQLE